MIRTLQKLFKKKEPVKIWYAEGHCTGDDQYSKSSGYSDLMATGSRCVALGVDAVLVPAGICSNSDIITLEEKLNDPLNPINRCVFCRDGIHCYFDGGCENKKALKEKEND